MRLTVIGCSGSMSGRQSAASSYLVQADGHNDDGEFRTYSFVMDFGPGAMGQLLNYTDPAELNAMFLSHLHTDHCADIVGMQVYRRWLPAGPLSRLDVYCPGDGLSRTRQIGGDPIEETYAGEFSFTELRAGMRVEVGPMVVEAFEAWHTVPALGLRITGPSDDEPGRDVVFGFTGDTDYCESEVEMARGVDLLLAESAFEDGRDSVRGVHMTGERAGRLAAQAQAGRLLLTHLQPWTSPEKVRRAAEDVYHGPVRCVEPGDIYRL
ncbi:MAG: MBL fold metallo-hydrolase [Actinomycetaceae bacterium]|nr:MBL fold metallo-hydrolase [Actinomycetaceae bacterium]